MMIGPRAPQVARPETAPRGGVLAPPYSALTDTRDGRDRGTLHAWHTDPHATRTVSLRRQRQGPRAEAQANRDAHAGEASEPRGEKRISGYTVPKYH